MFSPIEIRGKRIKNRIFFAPTHTGLANEDCSVSEDILAWIIARAKGGAGLIVSEVIRSSDLFGSEFDRVATIHDDKKKDGWRKYAEYSKYWGGIAIAQLTIGFGKQALPNPLFGEYVAPSPITLSIPPGSCDTGLKVFEGLVFPEPRELTTEECDQLVEDFSAALQRLKDCGFDGVELHGCHGYLLSQFLSPLHNQRTDKYGGSFENRLTMSLALLKAAREVGGDDWIVGHRMSSSDHAEGGNTVEDYAQCAKIFEENGADFISLSMGGTWNLKKQYPGREGTMVEEHSQIKKAVSVPVLSPSIHRPQTGEKALAEGMVDMVGLSRSLIADPYWPKKVEKGVAHTINRCILCNTCLVSLFTNFKLRCAANPSAGWEKFDPEYWPPPRIPIPPVKWE
jgi:2,4-dienoyl-CoA reductase-like NADH-dependent reductase (Old Yellow Enzyme family)